MSNEEKDASSRPPALTTKDLLSLCTVLTCQGGLKFCLSQGDHFLLTTRASASTRGIYGIAVHYGSLVPRLLLLPLEEAAKAYFSTWTRNTALSDNTPSIETTSTDTDDFAKRMTQEHHGSSPPDLSLLTLLLKFNVYLGLVFAIFGTTYVYLLLSILMGPSFATGPIHDTLRTYCLSIGFLALNGVLEAFVAATASSVDLMTLNCSLVVSFTVAFLAGRTALDSGAGPVGLILANMLNMSCRIVTCLLYIRMRFNHNSGQRWLWWPSSAVLVTSGVLVVVLQMGSPAYYSSHASMAQILAHLVIGLLGGLVWLGVSYHTDRTFWQACHQLHHNRHVKKE